MYGWMYACVYICVSLCVYVYGYGYGYGYVYVYVYVYVRLCKCARACVRACVCVRARVSVCVCARECGCACVYVCGVSCCEALDTVQVIGVLFEASCQASSLLAQEALISAGIVQLSLKSDVSQLSHAGPLLRPVAFDSSMRGRAASSSMVIFNVEVAWANLRILNILRSTSDALDVYSLPSCRKQRVITS